MTEGSHHDMHGIFGRCSRCGAVYISATEIHVPWQRAVMRLWCNRGGLNGCAPQPVGEERVRKITGLSEVDLLGLVYEEFRRYDGSRLRSGIDAATRAEVERRLGMSPVDVTGVERSETEAYDVAGALSVLAERALPAAPVLDAQRIHHEYRALSAVWRSPPLWVGTPEEASASLAPNLRVHASRSDFRYFRVDVLPQELCAQVNVLLAGSFLGYRVWRDPHQVYLCGPRGANF
jgi:hypothetical protein